jgi:hypothetical protein
MSFNTRSPGKIILSGIFLGKIIEDYLIFSTNLESGETFAKRGTRTKESNRAFLCPTFGRELFSNSIGNFRV